MFVHRERKIKVGGGGDGGSLYEAGKTDNKNLLNCECFKYTDKTQIELSNNGHTI